MKNADQNNSEYGLFLRCDNGIFRHIHLGEWSHFSQSYFVTSLVLFTKNIKLWNERKEGFFVYMAASLDHVLSKEVGNRIFRHNFRHSCKYKQPMLTKHWNYIIFVQIFHSSLSYINRLLDVFYFLVTVTLSEFHDKPRRKD